MRVMKLAAALVMAASGAVAQQCGEAERIVALSERVIDARGDMGRFRPGRVGGMAAVLMVNYGDLDDAEALALFERLRSEGRPYTTVDDLETAYLINRRGVMAGLSHGGQDPVDGFAKANFSTRRAILLADNGESFFDLLAQVKARPDLWEEFERSWFHGNTIHALLLDQPDAVRREIAERAEAAGELAIAGTLLAGLEDGTAYDAFVARHEGTQNPSWVFAQPGQMNYNGVAALHRAGPYPRSDRALTDNDQRMYEVMQAMVMEQGASFLGIVMNQTGRVDEVAAAARAARAAVDEGRIDPARQPDQMWRESYRALVIAMGPEAAHRTLSSFDLNADRRHYSGRAQEVMDMLIAVEVSRDWLRGEGPVPRRSTLLSPEFDFGAWLAVGDAVRKGERAALTEVAPGLQMMAIEQMWVRGEIDGAVDLAFDLYEPVDAARVAMDFAQRLDLGCAGYSSLPHDGMLLGGLDVYRFE